MSHVGYKILLFFLRALIVLKRALVAVGSFIRRQFVFLNELYTETLGLRMYKIGLYVRKKMAKIWPTGWNGFGDLMGRRGVLQLVLFVSLFALMAPQTRLFSKDTAIVPGQRTLLYKLVGPGDQDFQLEEIYADSEGVIAATDGSVWRQGAVTTVPRGTSPAVITEPQEVTSLSAGGGAVIKPRILPGNTFVAEPGDTGRTEVVIYQVKAGDVIGTIATKYQISVATILWANNLTVRSYIRPGDQLKIPPTDGVLHTVKKGDTISKIARLYGAKEDTIVKFNKLQANGSDIVVGETLIVPGGEKATTVAAAPRRTSPLSPIAAPPPSIAAPAGSGYIWPAGVRRVTQYYGWRHTGVDIAGPVGTPLYAAREGTVIRSQCGWNGGYGCHIIIDHGGGVNTLYGHASQLLVKVGEHVEQGQSIGLMGSTGNSTGPHLHFEVRLSGKRTNPLQYVR